MTFHEVGYGPLVAKTRTYIVELESAPVGQRLSELVLDAFTSAIASNRKLARSTPSADLDLGMFELRTSVAASGATNALAIAEVAFVGATEKAGVKTVITEACVWTDEQSPHEQ